jgi:uncharacterized protein (DUF2062 family)
MRDWLRRRVLAPLKRLLTQGVSPEKIALSIAIGAIVGIFPVLGTTAVLCTIIAAAMRLNLVVVHAVHYAMTPVQILLIIPFVRVGEHLVGASPQKLSIKEGMALISMGVWHAVNVLWDAIIHAMIGWVAIGPVAIVLSALVLTRVLKKLRPAAPTPATDTVIPAKAGTQSK